MLIGMLAATAATPAEEADARLDAFGPHVAYYDKQSTGKPALEIHYTSPTEVLARALSPEGTFEMSVDASHAWLRVDAETCAGFEARAVIAEVVALGGYADPETPKPRLTYRATPEAGI